jgi:hypothetical protein
MESGRIVVVGQHLEGKKFVRPISISQAWQYTPVIPATPESICRRMQYKACPGGKKTQDAI